MKTYKDQTQDFNKNNLPSFFFPFNILISNFMEDFFLASKGGRYYLQIEGICVQK